MVVIYYKVFDLEKAAQELTAHGYILCRDRFIKGSKVVYLIKKGGI